MAVYAASWRAKLVRLHRSDFYGRLRDRFALADAPAAAADAGNAPLRYHPASPPPEDLRQFDLPGNDPWEGDQDDEGGQAAAESP